MAADVMMPGFWEIGNYKHNVRRIKDGTDQLEDYSKMIRERSEIEAKYGKALQQFTERWNSHVERTVPPGSVKTAWTSVISEADSLSHQHCRVRDRLLEEIAAQLATFRKENHHPSAFRAPKEIREIEDAFEKAQRQWKKLHDKMESSRKAYYTSYRQEKSAEVNLNNCKADSSISPDGALKYQERCDKAKEDVAKTRTQYEKMLDELSQYRTPYVESMSFVFEKCQQMELKRSKFFIEQISGTARILSDLVRNNQFVTLHDRLEMELAAMDEPCLQGDLKEWSSQNGVDAPTQWPVFQDYTPEMRTIASRGHPSKAPSSGGVVLTRQVIKTDDIIATAGPASSGTSDNGKNSSDSDTNTFDSRKTDKKFKHSEGKPWNDRVAVDSPPLSNITPDSAKYGDFDDFHGVVKSNATVLYDYTPIENDEIRLKKGDTIEILSDADSLGWCTGRKNGEVGLFPFSYVQVQ